jgi:hypothetical protein
MRLASWDLRGLGSQSVVGPRGEIVKRSSRFFFFAVERVIGRGPLHVRVEGALLTLASVQ